MYVNLPDIYNSEMHRKAEEEAEGFSSDNGMWIRRSFDEEKLSSTTIIFFLFLPNIQPISWYCETWGNGYGRRNHATSTTLQQKRSPIHQENLLLESPIGLSSCSACISRANLAGWTVCPLGILTDEYKLHYLAFSFQLGYLCCVTKYISIWSHSEQQEKTYSGVETRILYSIYNLQKVRRLTVFVSHHPEKKQTNQNQGRRVTIAKGWGFFFWYS